MDIHWRWQPFADISGREMHEILAVRQEVFVVEQQCVYRDADELDLAARHLTGQTVDGRIVAYARLIAPGAHFAEPSIGRVLTRMDIRRRGIARRVVSLAIDECNRVYPAHDIRIGAQLYLKKFYVSFGFFQVGSEYTEDGIEHIEMIRPRRA
ncbi:MAG: GNAT family N-acetyltransferase [Desulfopila sp.]|jgi:ElaA protein|nr:GNAT family N-acetyltransferase [Desulfopila sp.]